MSLQLLSVGVAVPDAIMAQDSALAVALAVSGGTAEQRTWLPGMYEHTGIATRHTQFEPALIADVLADTRSSGSVFLPAGSPDDRGPTTGQRMREYQAKAGPLAVESSRRALERAGVSGDRVTHLITVTCTGFHAPGIDLPLIGSLGLPATTQRTQIGYMGCHGAINGLRVAQAFVESRPEACVLLCAVELCTVHYYYGWDPQRMIANAIFADGAAAVVATSEPSAGAWRLRDTGSCLIPDSANAMTWTIADHGFEMTLSKKVPELIHRQLRPWLESWLAGHGLRISEVASWAIHPGGPKILDAVEESLELPAEATNAARSIFSRFGNMSSPTVLFILDELRRRNAPLPCVALGFGPGLVAEGALFV
jgi:predicted naringenin-chalcone synthase